MNKRQKANIKAVKNALCRVEDRLTLILIGKTKNSIQDEIIKIRDDIDSCVYVLEMLRKTKQVKE
jgi:hypothetical protein